jgi:hypothetical protein
VLLGIVLKFKNWLDSKDDLEMLKVGSSLGESTTVSEELETANEEDLERAFGGTGLRAMLYMDRDRCGREDFDQVKFSLGSFDEAGDEAFCEAVVRFSCVIMCPELAVDCKLEI